MTKPGAKTPGHADDDHIHTVDVERTPGLIPDIALAYASFGWRVVPIRSGTKEPDMKEWPRLATTDPRVIGDWWMNGHAGAGIGICTGVASGIFVLDVDDNGVDKFGRDTLAALEAEHGRLPATPTVLTPSGGLHIYFKWPGFNPKQTLGDWLDIRGEARQVLAPPSVHPNGGIYEWEEGFRPSQIPVADAPEWMLAMLRPTLKPISGELDDRYAAVFTAAGWTFNRLDGDGHAHWVRPGKNPRDGASATVYVDHATIWSTSVPGIEVNRPYLPHELSRALNVPEALGRAPEEDSHSGITLQAASTILVRRQRWLWKGRIPLGGAVLLAGQEGLGKSSVAVDLAASVTRGDLDGDLDEPGSVVYVSAEDSEASTLVPRFIAAKADLERVFFVRLDGESGGLQLPLHLAQLSAQMEEVDARLLVLDPLSVHIGDDHTDSHKERDVRRALAPLATAMGNLDAAAIGIMHWNKSPTTVALDRVLGSRAFTAAARAVLGVGPDPQDEEQRLIILVKNNLGTMKAPAIAFRLDGRYIPDPAGGQPIQTSGVAWRGEREGVHSSDLFRAGDDEKRSAGSEAEGFLRGMLVERQDSKAVRAAWRRVGVGSESTLERAARNIGVVSEQEGFGPEKVAWWSLPQDPSHQSRHTPAIDDDEIGDDETAIIAPDQGEHPIGPSNPVTSPKNDEIGVEPPSGGVADALDGDPTTDLNRLREHEAAMERLLTEARWHLKEFRAAGGDLDWDPLEDR
jgi:Bifunctional DNA primase/polymerase, N-terminal/AAA domain